MGRARDGSKERLLKLKENWTKKGIANDNQIDNLEAELEKLKAVSIECWRNVGIAEIELQRRERKNKGENNGK